MAHHSAQDAALFQLLAGRLQRMPEIAKKISWQQVQTRLEAQPDALSVLHTMETSGGEPALVDIRKGSAQLVFCDSSPESPAGRRSLCYDEEALHQRKENKPAGSAMGLATAMRVQLIDEAQYRMLQQVAGPLDTKTSSWIATPQPIRVLGGAIFGDYRYGQVFIYHNGAASYYASRGFRAMLVV